MNASLPTAHGASFVAQISRADLSRRLAGATTLLRNAVGVLQHWRTAWVQRNALAQFNDRELRDIGVDRATAVVESGKPFWLR